MRKIDIIKEKYFECGGKKFILIDDPGIIRYRILQKLSVEFAYSSSVPDMFNNLHKAIDAFNKHKYDEMVIIIHNVLNGITKIEDKDDAALRLCTLFIVEEKEDLTVWDEVTARMKIDCWAKEIAAISFFQLASSLVPGWMPAYELHIQHGLIVEEPKEEELIED